MEMAGRSWKLPKKGEHVALTSLLSVRYAVTDTHFAINTAQNVNNAG